VTHLQKRFLQFAALLAAVFAAPPAFADDIAFVHHPAMESRTAVTVALPPAAKPGEHPMLMFSKAQLPAVRDSFKNTQRGKTALANLLKIADGVLNKTPDFPDPKGPGAQLKDRRDDLAKRHDRLSFDAGNLARAYTLTGDKKYAAKSAEILKGYAARYAEYPEHKGVNKSDTGKVMAQRLSEAMWLLPLLEAYDEIHDSGALTPADDKLIEEKLLRAAVIFIRGKKSPADEAAARTRSNPNWRTTPPAPVKGKPVGNWLNFYAAATMMTGAVTHDQDMMDLAAADYRIYLQNGISDDGMWSEGAIGYQLFAMEAMATGFEAAARQGIDLYGFQNARFKLLFDSPLWYAYPDSTLPGINDSGRVTLGDWTTEVYDFGYLRYGDKRYATLIDRSPRQLSLSEGLYAPTWINEKIEPTAATVYPSMLFANLGYGIMRDTERYVLLKAGHPSGVHEHLDKLNMVLFDGDELGGEPVFHRYEDPIHDQWTKVTLAHNTMTVDEHSQAIGTADFSIFQDAGNLKVMRAQTNNVYPGVAMDRTIILLPGATLDIYRAGSQAEHTFDSTLRYQGTLDGMPSTPGAPKLGSKDGYEHLSVMQRKPAATGWTGTWETKAGKLDVVVAAAKNQEIILGTGPDKDNIALLRQKGKSALFAKALKTIKSPAPITAFKPLDTNREDLAAYELTQADATTTVYVSYATGKWKVGNVQSDAKVLVVTTPAKAEPAQILLTGGTSATIDGADIKLEKPGNYAATLTAGKAQITTKWTP